MITREAILKKFDGNEKEARVFMQALVDSEKQKLKETKELFNPEGETMKNLDKELDRAAYVSFAPFWKRTLINLKLMK